LIGVNVVARTSVVRTRAASEPWSVMATKSALKSLTSGAALFIGNDSGPAHVAAAFGIPVVVLFGPSDPVTWAPWRTEARVLTSGGSIDQITLEEVMAAAEALRNGTVKAEA